VVSYWRPGMATAAPAKRATEATEKRILTVEGEATNFTKKGRLKGVREKVLVAGKIEAAVGILKRVWATEVEESVTAS